MKIKLTVTNVPDDLVPEAFSGLEMEELGATSEIVDPKAVMTDNAVFRGSASHSWPPACGNSGRPCAKSNRETPPRGASSGGGAPGLMSSRRNIYGTATDHRQGAQTVAAVQLQQPP